MAYTDSDIYYPTNSTSESVASSMQQFAESVSGKLNIVQAVSSETSTLVTSTSMTEYTASGLSATITPKFASSSILVLATLPYSVGLWSNSMFGLAWAQANFRLLKGSSIISSFSGGINGVGYWLSSETIFNDSLSASYTDKPNTTSPITYSISGIISNAPVATKYLRMNYAQGAAAKSSIMLLEVVA